MMKNMIIAAIGAINEKSDVKIADWRLVSTVISRQEEYFIASEAEQLRAVDERRYALTVYVDSEADGVKFRGEATVTIQPTHTEAEIEATIRQAVFAASKSKNPWFELPGPAQPKVSLPSSGFDALADSSRMDTVRAALYAPETKIAEAGAPAADPEDESRDTAPGAAVPAVSTPRINSLELFIAREESGFINSKGLKFEAARWKGYSEFVVEADSRQGPVELFDDIEFSDPDPVRLGEATGSRLAQVRDRAVAIPMPSLKDIPVILSGKEAEEVFAWFFGNSTTGAIFTKASPFTLGMNIQQAREGQKVEDPIDIWAEPTLPGLPASSVFDPDGFPLERAAIVEGGYLKALVGAIRYADWLGVDRKGSFPLFSVSPGSMSVADMVAKPHLAPVMFSDFRLDSVTGDFGAEIRLAYWFDGKRRIPVTGGSISASVSELRSTMRRSAECALASRSFCPKAVLLNGVSITGMA
ncbi:MAG TPA: metallopeptidase TldD-related protein [Rectinemataceae bacterium]|nr:metallopeptidase TldD-related protein [Rectinemataceae bacterium]